MRTTRPLVEGEKPPKSPEPTGEVIHSCGDPWCDVCGLPGFGPKGWENE